MTLHPSFTDSLLVFPPETEFKPHCVPYSSMPRIGGGCKSTARKPLSDASNCQKPSRIWQKKMNRKEKENDGNEDPSLDRLASINSDLSKLTNQIDELVLQAYRRRVATKVDPGEIESFINFLSDMYSSLKSWIPRFEKAFDSSLDVSSEEIEKSLCDKSAPDLNATNNILGKDTEETMLDLIVSPSPLVSWRKGTCILESGKQLFLLTPLPKTKPVPRCPDFPQSSVEKHTGKEPFSTKRLPQVSSSLKFLPDDVTKMEEAKQSQNLLSRTSDDKKKVERDLLSPLMISSKKIKDHSVYLLTPCLKSSLANRNAHGNPINELFQDKEVKVYRTTPWANRDKCKSLGDFNCDNILEDFASRYPELLDTRLVSESPAAQDKDVNELFEWFLSPPKTCVLMEPPNRKISVASTSERLPDQGLKCSNLEFHETTPMLNGLGSTTWKGKGESTLKKELWTKFEAVSAPHMRVDAASIFQKSSKKGFLEMLDEVSKTVGS